MLIFDVSGVLIAALMGSIGNHHNIELSEDNLRTMSLNTIRALNKKFKGEYKNVVLACDDKHQWRRDIFPYYKAARKKEREKSEINWKLAFDTFNKIKDELRDNFPYRVIQVPGAEGDDVIACLVKRYYNEDPEGILILSTDKDQMQLQRYAGVRQYSPVQKKFLKTDNPLAFLKEHIIRGDRVDGIPSFNSADGCFITGERQKKVMQTSVDRWIHMEPAEFCTTNELMRGWKRNEQLISFDFIPERIESDVIAQYEQQVGKDRSKLFNYLTKTRQRALLENIGDF